jgi:hypothetical protein
MTRASIEKNSFEADGLVPGLNPGRSSPAMTNAGLRIAPRADGSHVRVAVFIVNNNPETMERSRPHVKVGSSHDAASDRAALVSRAQRSMKRSGMMRCRPGTAAVRGGPGSAMHHSLALALHRVRDTQASDAFVALFTFQTAHLVPAACFCARGFATLLHSPRSEGWAERRETFGCSAEHPWGVSCASTTRVN